MELYFSMSLKCSTKGLKQTLSAEDTHLLPFFSFLPIASICMQTQLVKGNMGQGVSSQVKGF